MGLLPALPAKGVARREQLMALLLVLGRVSLLIRLCRWVLVDGYRHIRARGLGRSVRELYASLQNVRVRPRHL
jgi:hypothetical protein